MLRHHERSDRRVDRPGPETGIPPVGAPGADWRGRPAGNGRRHERQLHLRGLARAASRWHASAALI
ncbi:hypothetical protein ABTM11_20555, partial [Acinetobacter baumannii]